MANNRKKCFSFFCKKQNKQLQSALFLYDDHDNFLQVALLKEKLKNIQQNLQTLEKKFKTLEKYSRYQHALFGCDSHTFCYELQIIEELSAKVNKWIETPDAGNMIIAKDNIAIIQEKISVLVDSCHRAQKSLNLFETEEISKSQNNASENSSLNSLTFSPDEDSYEPNNTNSSPPSPDQKKRKY